MAPQRAADSNKRAKEVLDEIGKEVEKKATAEAVPYQNALQGILSQAKFHGQSIHVKNPCDLKYEIHTNVAKDREKENPCRGRVEERFSDSRSGQCTNRRIKGNNTENGGACAPYRRLHICDRNLELIKPDQITSTHNLLVDVLLAAKHEGKSLVDKHKKYKETHKDTNICTVLARSFAGFRV
ncbi:erythrocyte membrane protein 1 (PfEMP1) [Plasmodium falciparum NF54]|uniref:Erythrocyte membrane protein 1 (PfEMP1) n=2 Tax=Plasmodium falciparum TaxID=5833 RepID=W7JKP4_PLAFO|nr:hypothetical protein PFNF54_05942 [Plasmodium falciparum NF54]KAF4330825.1 erythrocyte membrane protein 1 (PfEMP1) [Plasmodium falciparum NF54]PKC49355.1 erythrocyte membrane protein 1 (PfEMP1) [Plasmodium falciparum NF54]